MKVKKIKITFLVFFLLLISSFSYSLVAQENSTDKSIFLDSDQDGLSNKDEIIYKTDAQKPDTDGDGYSDGAEVKSGYDPAKPAPGDKLTTGATSTLTTDSNLKTSLSGTKNLTEEISDQIASMVSSSDSSKGIDVNSINNLIEEKISSHISFSDLPKIDDSTIIMKVQNYSGYGKDKQARLLKEDNQEYLSAVFYIMANNLPHSVNSKEAIQEFSDEIMKKIPSIISSDDGSGLNYFTDLADRGSAMLEKLNELEVPADMLEIHKKGLQLANYAISLKEKVKVDNNDPIASIVSFSEVENLMVLGNDYLSETETELEKLGLTNFVAEQTTNL
jgi:hypothetical protein